MGDWLHRSVAGLAPAEPGYRRLRVRPLPGPGLTWARTRHLTPYGPARVAWALDGDHLDLEVEVPPNTTAEVVVPGTGETVQVAAGTHQWRAPGRSPSDV